MASFVPDKNYPPAQLYQEKVKYNLAGQIEGERKNQTKRGLDKIIALARILLFIYYNLLCKTCLNSPDFCLHPPREQLECWEPVIYNSTQDPCVYQR